MAVMRPSRMMSGTRRSAPYNNHGSGNSSTPGSELAVEFVAFSPVKAPKLQIKGTVSDHFAY